LKVVKVVEKRVVIMIAKMVEWKAVS